MTVMATPPRVAVTDDTNPAPVRAHAEHGEAGSHRTIRLLVFTSLYPNAEQPRHGVFVEERLRHLVDSGRVTATVIAPVPWFPFRHRSFGAYAAFARVPPREERHGIRIEHPRYPVIPKVGMRMAPALMYHASLPTVRKHLTEANPFDLIDAHYAYPDGVAAARMGRIVHKPVVITARGSDINVIARHRSPRRQIRQAAHHAAAMITVSRTLQEKARAMGIDADTLTVLRNGVDLSRFRPLDRKALRAELGLTGPTWLSVGNLVELKGVHLTLGALAFVDTATLLVVGDGPEADRLRHLAVQLGVQSRVRFLGNRPHDELVNHYNVADALMLASSREGMPNVVLEALACGTPVVAAPYAGVAELLNRPEAGEVAKTRSAEALADAWQRLQARTPRRAETRRIAEQLGWAPVIEQQCALYARVLAAFGKTATSGANR